MRTFVVAVVGLASLSGLALGCNALVGASEPEGSGKGLDSSVPRDGDDDGDANGVSLPDATVHDGGGTDAPADATLDRTAPFTDGGDGGGGDAAVDDGGADAIVLCTGACIPGNTRCDDGGVVTCAQTAAPCPTWSPEVACPRGETCSTSGVSAFCCNDCCDSTSGCGATSCSGDAGGGGINNCGPSFSESCCASTLVQGGTFFRDEDAVSYPDRTFPAQVSSFALDRFEVTVGRFRPFVEAWDQGWRPAPGSGKHTHLNAGRGLVDSSADAGTYEVGWDSTWNTTIGASAADWNDNLACDSMHHTWTPDIGTAESHPINCVSWYEAYAFCIWDGGFLPSEAEWNYAAAGGGGADGQRVYPWSSPATSSLIDCEHASSAPDCGASIYTVGKVSPTGDGKWGQSDLVGNVWEWTVDFQASFVNPCVDCAFLTDARQGNTLRGADFGYPAAQLEVAYRLTAGTPATTRYADDGVRCARAP